MTTPLRSLSKSPRRASSRWRARCRRPDPPARRLPARRPPRPGRRPLPGWRTGKLSPASRPHSAQYFRGERTTFDLPLDVRGTPFQRRVGPSSSRSPFGATVSYAEVARRIGEAGSSAGRRGRGRPEPAFVVIPCHRVVGADGALTGATPAASTGRPGSWTMSGRWPRAWCRYDADKEAAWWQRQQSGASASSPRGRLSRAERGDPRRCAGPRMGSAPSKSRASANGYQGLINLETRELHRSDFSGILTLGGTILGSSREKPYEDGERVSDSEAAMSKPDIIKANYRKLGLDCLVVLGGNGTHTTAHLPLRGGAQPDRPPQDDRQRHLGHRRLLRFPFGREHRHREPSTASTPPRPATTGSWSPR